MWAVGCPQATQAIRSCQIYRVLVTECDMEQVQTLLERTAPLLASDDPREIRLASEGLRTLERIVQLMSREQLLGDCKDLFWASCATLYSDCEEHFTLSVKLIGTLLEKLSDVGDLKALEVLRSRWRATQRAPEGAGEGATRAREAPPRSRTTSL